jgi:hypothetical protein
MKLDQNGDFPVRTLLAILSFLALIGWGACHLDPPAMKQASIHVAERPWDWRRTAAGWERSHQWWPGGINPTPSLASTISPVYVALLEVGISLAALVAFPSRCLRNGEKSRHASTETAAGRH